MISSSARLRGSARGRRYRPPAAAISRAAPPGRPKAASSAATARSQASTISQPPASALPLTAAIHGLVRSACTKPAKPPRAVNRSLPRPAATSFRSAPAQKVPPPAPVITIAHRSGSASVSATMSSSAAATAPLMTALRASGRFSVTRPTWPGRRCRVTTEGCHWGAGSSCGSVDGGQRVFIAANRKPVRRHVGARQVASVRVAQPTLRVSRGATI